MSIAQAISDVLQADSRLKTLLAPHSLDPTKLAIYEEWAERETQFPYMAYSLSYTEGMHYAKQDTVLNLDIFTWTNSIQAEDIKEACIFALDRHTITDPTDGALIRIYYSRDGFIVEPADYITHWNLEFNVYHWRNDFITHLLTE
jgi:hypothetical protein